MAKDNAETTQLGNTQPRSTCPWLSVKTMSFPPQRFLSSPTQRIHNIWKQKIHYVRSYASTQYNHKDMFDYPLSNTASISDKNLPSKFEMSFPPQHSKPEC
jgi:hypothetical protein